MTYVCNFMRCLYNGHVWKEVPRSEFVKNLRWLMGRPNVLRECERCGRTRESYE